QIVAQDRYPNDLVRRGFCIGEGQAVYRADVIQGGPIEGPGPVLCEVPAPRVESEAAGDRKIGIRDLVESGAIMPPDGAPVASITPTCELEASISQRPEEVPRVPMWVP